MATIRVGWARKMARQLLAKYGISKPGTPVLAMVKEEGVEIRWMDWPPGVSGIRICVGHQVIIGINGNHHDNRQRFSLAHEFGHHVLQHDQVDTAAVTLENPPGAGEVYSVDCEKEANEFAGELLVPMRILKEVNRREKNPATLAHLFKVSREVMFISLTKHRLL